MRSRTWKYKWRNRKSKIWKSDNIYSTSRDRICGFKMVEKWRRNNKWMSNMDRRRIGNRSEYMNGDMSRI
jgi:hypothetical protein